MTQDQRHQASFLQRCEEAYDLVTAFLNDTLPWGFVPERHSGYKYQPSVRAGVKEKIRRTMDVLSNAINSHGLEEIAISYNGGKDCLVMLVLVLATIHKNSGKSSLPPDYKLDSIYVNLELAFPQLSAFIETSTAYYHLNPVSLKDSMKSGFEHYLNDVNPRVNTIIVGIRHSDPYGASLQYEQMTDHNWPRFLRIHPILHWNYVDIWDFLIGCNLDYCPVYDDGYTSLGGVQNTVPNPFLKRADGSYQPAYMLSESADERERLGRHPAAP